MQRIPINAQRREATGKGPNRRLRAAGHIPAVLYGLKGDAINLSLSEHEFQKSTAKLADEMVMFDLTAPDAGIKHQLTMIREAQRDPVTERIVHIDFFRIDVEHKIDVFVSVHHSATPAIGVREGGMLEQILRKLHIRCKPEHIPPHIEVDLADLAIGHAFHVSDLKLEDDTIEVLSPGTDVIFHIPSPRVMEARAARAEAEAMGAETAPEETAEPKAE